MNKNLLFNRFLILTLIASTMGIAGVVAAKTIPQASVNTMGDSGAQTKIEGSVDLTVTASPTDTKIVDITPTTRPTNTPTTIPTSIPTAVITPKVTASGGCIVTLFGQKYDVASLRRSHSGGDIFKCDTDMSSVYQGQHGNNLNQMQRYLIGSNGTVANPQPTNFSEDKKDDDREEDDD